MVIKGLTAFVFLSFFFASFVVADVEFSVSPLVINESSNVLYNLTVNNSNSGSISNISEIAVVLDNFSFEYVGQSNGTSSLSSFNYSSYEDAIFLNWTNFTGYVVDGDSFEYFLFNLTGILSGFQQIGVFATNGTDTIFKEISVEVKSVCDAFLVNSTCDVEANCTWSEEFDRCGPSCQDYSSESSCEDIGGGYCMWDDMSLEGEVCMFMPFSQESFGCNIDDPSTCESNADCTWEAMAGMCIVDCFKHDSEQGGNSSSCEAAYGGSVCIWEEDWFCKDNPNATGCEGDPGICDPFFFDKGFDGFSPCFEFDANKTGCESLSDECVWFSEPSCPVDDWCYDSVGSEHGFCNPKGGFDFGGDFSCYLHDGNKQSCKDSIEQSQWACSWNPDPWGPLVNGTESGWCNMIFGGGGSGGGSCWDYFDEDGCNSALNLGMPCSWESSDGAICEEKGCWDYWSNETCVSHESEGCVWNEEYDYCYDKQCWDLTSEATCGSADTSYGLDCSWRNDTWGGGGKCEENGCWNRDWTNSTYCEAKSGCYWDGGSRCFERGCWDFDGTNQTACESKNLTGMNCRWNDKVTGWCEEQGCWSYEKTNQTACENLTADFGMDCVWDNATGREMCYEQMKGCSDYDNEFGCFGTGWCTWNGTSCKEPEFQSKVFWNPGCWVFDQAGEAKCSNVTSCIWGGSSCDDNGADGNQGVQCSDINESVMCNNIPMLSTCCQWNGTGCQAAPMSSSCWDLQEPPEGAAFCEDYNAKYSQSTCEQISGDPWYMPCEWDSSIEECKFAGDDMFGGDATEFSFKDIGSKSNCEANGGVWKEEKWSDETGNVFWDKWCEPNSGVGSKSCGDACWACEYQNNGSIWSSMSSARGACESSSKGCVFYEDTGASNGFGWCDLDDNKQGNCDDNCWECWDSNQCKDSAASCKWFTDSWDDGFGWCDSKNVKTCDDTCFNCGDKSNCQASDAGCSWNADQYFCQPSGTGDGGESYEICFDGVDNDNDNFFDCADPECMFSDFCGGASVFGAGADCVSIESSTTCLNESLHPTYNCTWITDAWDNSWCDVPGAQCWIYDDNQTACGLEEGCQYNTMEQFGKADEIMCDINFSYMDNAQCWDYGQNDTICSAQPGCAWQTDEWCLENPNDSWCSNFNSSNGYMPGFCDNEIWSCVSYDDNQTACNMQSHCAWQTDEWCSTPEGQEDPWCQGNPGFCDPVCFARNFTTCEGNVNISGSDTSGVCELRNASQMGWCESENNFKGCWGYDDNQTECELHNTSCTWISDPLVYGGGFCGDLFMFQMTGGMDKSPPFYFSSENCQAGANATRDICEIGVKDSPEKFGLVTSVYSMQDSAFCNNSFEFDETFAGNKSSRFYWYLDSNGIRTGGCNASDSSGYGGFDLKFKYETTAAEGQVNEVKVAYKCLNGTWSPSQIKTNVWPEKMCYMFDGGAIAINKEDVEKLNGYFSESADIRIYATTGSETNPYDTAGPIEYTPNSADFKFEDCEGFTDKDGDGLVPSEDPDCIDFLKNGFVDIEKGTDCDDGKDNDGNGLVDCSDAGCMYDSYYCDASSYENDKTAPKITWMETEPFFDGAFVGVDTNEPTNAIVYFYKNDSYCSNISNSIVIYDSKLNNSFASDDYDFWHDFPLENSSDYFVSNNYSIGSNSTYYFKVKLCDKQSNCALSACTSFKTASNFSEYRVGFDLPTKKSNVSEMMGKMEVQFDWDRDGDFEDKIDGVSGFKINESKGRDVDLKFYNPNASSQWSVDFKGADFVKAQDIDISDAFVVNMTSEGDPFVGMDSANWKKMAQALGVKEVEVVIPQTISNVANAKLMHCPDNVSEISTDEGCVELSLSDINCTFGTTTSTCRIPSSIGFSVLGITETSTPVVDDGGDDDNGPSGGGGGGGGASPALVTDDGTNDTISVSDGPDSDSESPSVDNEMDDTVPGESFSFWPWVFLVFVIGLVAGMAVYFGKGKKHKVVSSRYKKKK